MEEAWEVVVTASGMVTAKIIAGRLEVEGIPTHLKYDVAGALYAVTINGLGAVKVMVPTEDLTRAKVILAQSYEDKDEGEKGEG